MVHNSLAKNSGSAKHKIKRNFFLPAGIKNFFTHDFFKNSIVHWILIAAIFLNLINWALILVYIRPVDFPIILHYNVYLGVDLIGGWWQVYLLPSIGVIILLGNTLLAFWLFVQQERIASYILLLAALIIQFSLIIASASIIAINY